MIDLRLGDCLEVLKTIPDNSVDSVVTDPPYGLSFMGKKWDYDVPSTDIWKECLRVLKPGGHLLSFASSRTYHRMAINIEDAGFEIRDQMMWIYGSGFPKSHNIGKNVDKKLGNEREVVGTSKGKGYSSIQEKNLEHGNRPYVDGLPYEKADRTLTKGNSEWEGWGTALKPAHEPIVMARKPLSKKTVVDNVLEWGTGGINIDESRIKYQSNEMDKIDFDRPRVRESANSDWVLKQAHDYTDASFTEYNQEGRWPANVLLSEDAAENLDEHTGILKGDSPNRKPRNGGHRTQYVGTDNNEKKKDVISDKKFTDVGGASRYFYVAKPSKKEKDFAGKNTHPTVKPIKLMEYLITMVTPKGGTTLDPFMGSGSSGVAAVNKGFNFIGIEREPDYMEIARQRINAPRQSELDI